MTTLTCPKCAADMRSYERNRVLVDQCTGCGGLFLDRGELEALVTAENAWHQQQDAQSGPGRVQDSPRGGNHQQPVYQQQPAYHQQPAYQQPPAQRYAEAPYRAHSKAYYGQRRKRGFLSDLFDD